MNPADSFAVAERLGKFSTAIFWSMSALTGVLLIGPSLEWLIGPFLILGAIAGIVCGLLVGINQTQGNRWLRASQLTDALGVPIGDTPRSDYYNSPVPHSLVRLATTTLENSLFTTRVLNSMLHRERAMVALYLGLFILLIGFRWTPSGGLLFFAQLLFSADIVMNWIKMELFRSRVAQVHGHLRHFFVQGAKEDPAGIATILAAFTNYECSKDEAAIGIDGQIFDRLNPAVTAEWEDLKKTLHIV